MIPTIFHLGPIPVNSFGLMVALSIMSAFICLERSFRINSIDSSLAERFVFMGAISGLLGARLWYIAENFSELSSNLGAALVSGAGFTFYGGFIVAIAVQIVLCRVHKIRISTFFDSVGPTMALSYAIGRVGCQLSGDGDYGMATTSLWGMSYSTGVVPTPPGVDVFPTPMFESILCLVIFFIILRVERMPKWHAAWKRFGLYLLLIAAERFLVEFIRINERIIWGLSEAQLVSVFLFLMGTIMVLSAKFKFGQKEAV